MDFLKIYYGLKKIDTKTKICQDRKSCNFFSIRDRAKISTDLKRQLETPIKKLTAVAFTPYTFFLTKLTKVLFFHKFNFFQFCHLRTRNTRA
jgi:hypothetical protein